MENWKKIFAIIWSGQFMSILSSTIVNFAIILWISMETGSAEMLAYAAIAGMLPQALLGPVSGAFIDRWNRKAVMILADSFIAFCTFLLAVLFWMDIAEMYHIFILLALRSIGSAFHMPAMQASVPMLAPKDQLTRIAGINQVIQSVGNIAGPALGALFITLWDIEYVLMLDVAGAAFACTSLLFVYIPNPERTEQHTPALFKEIKEGIAIVLRNRALSWIFLFSILVMFFIMPVSVLFPLMTLEHFHGNAFQVSLIEVVWGIGALLGGGIMGAKVYAINKVKLLNSMYLLIGITFLLSGVLPEGGFIWFALLTGLSGVTGAVYQSAFTGIIQSNIEPVALGRVFSMFNTCSIIPCIVGLVGIGFFADNLGLPLSFIIGGISILGIGAVAFLMPSTFRIKA